MSTLLSMTGEAVALAERIAAVEECVADAATDDERAVAEQAVRDLEEELLAVAEGLEVKVDAYGDIIAEFGARAQVMKDQRDLYARKQQVAERAAQRMKDTLKLAMDTLGFDKMAGARWSLAVQASPPSVTVTDEGGALRAGFGEEVTTVKLDKRGVLAAWKQDPASVQEFAEVTTSTHLRVR